MPDKNKYPLLRYPGAKAKVAPLLSSLFPVEFQEYREVCAGSAALLAYVPRSVPRSINDLNDRARFGNIDIAITQLPFDESVEPSGCIASGTAGPRASMQTYSDSSGFASPPHEGLPTGVRSCSPSGNMVGGNAG